MYGRLPDDAAHGTVDGLRLEAAESQSGVALYYHADTSRLHGVAVGLQELRRSEGWRPDEPGDPMIWPRWTGFGETDPVTESRRGAVLAELRRERVRRHPLFGRISGIEAFHAASDDVLAHLDDGTLAVMHPTWSGRPERSESCPSFVLLGKGSEAAQCFRTHEGGWGDAELLRWEHWRF